MGGKGSGRKPNANKLPGQRSKPMPVLSLASQQKEEPMEMLPYPEDFSEEGKRLYLALAKAGVEDKILMLVDSPLLIAYCESWATWKRAMSFLRNNPLVYKTKSDNAAVTNQVWIANAFNKTLVKIAGELGCSPVGRSKMALELSKADEEWNIYVQKKMERLRAIK